MKAIAEKNLPKRWKTIVSELSKGEEYLVTSDDGTKNIALISSVVVSDDRKERVLGSLEGRIKVTFSDDFKMNDEELFFP